MACSKFFFGQQHVMFCLVLIQMSYCYIMIYFLQLTSHSGSSKVEGFDRKGKKTSKSSGLQSFGQLASQQKLNKTANKDLCVAAIEGLSLFAAL